MLEQVLIPDSELRATEVEVAKLMPTLDPRVIVDWSHSDYGTALLHFMLFEHWPFLLGDSQPANDEVLFYNKYYWFCRFVKSYCELNGRDFGIEQQGFKLLESAAGDVDWAIVEEIYELFPFERDGT
jgi:hypothetical protein